MKVHIEHEGVKRVIHGNFIIAADIMAIKHIIDCLQDAVDKSKGEQVGYIWVNIYDRTEPVSSDSILSWNERA